MRIDIFADGAFKKRDTVGGWAYILICTMDDGSRIYREYFNATSETTNQRMEILAALSGLKSLTRPVQVYLHSDSAYVVNCINDCWYVNWMSNGWRNSKGTTVANQDLWMQMIDVVEKHQVTAVKVKGHNAVFFNEYADHLANVGVDIYRDLMDGVPRAHFDDGLGVSKEVSESELLRWGEFRGFDLKAALLTLK